MVSLTISRLFLLICAALVVNYAYCFHNMHQLSGWKSTLSMSTIGPKPIEISVPLGDGYKPLQCSFKPLFQRSKFYTFTYPVPFELNVEKPGKDGVPAPVVKGLGTLGDQGEQIGDILRATTCWGQGMQAAGTGSDRGVYSGNIRWRKSVFYTVGATWEKVVEALLSNTEERSKEVTLVFERPLAEEDTA